MRSMWTWVSKNTGLILAGAIVAVGILIAWGIATTNRSTRWVTICKPSGGSTVCWEGRVPIEEVP